jgi:hypothetical protein
MNPISRICPVTDAEAAAMVRPETLADLAGQITAGQLPVVQLTADPAGPRGRRRPAPRWRRPLAGLAVATAAAAAILVVTSLGHPGQQVGPVGLGPPSAQALSFTRHGGYIYVIVRDPLADARKFRAEFRAHHLDITLELIPASPSLVGTLVEESISQGGGELADITARGRCFTGGGGNVCPVGVKVPVGYRGQASLYFGRAARPGERYETTAPATAPGEVMHGMHFVGKTVADVLRMLAGRHVTVPVFHYITASGIGELLRPGQVPGDWHVYDADPWAYRQVMLWVGASPTQVTPLPRPYSGHGPRPAPGISPSPSARP